MSLTDLIQDPSQLSGSTSTLYGAKWSQILPSSAATFVNFSQGSYRYLFSSAPSEWWVPSRTYIRLKIRISVGDAGQSVLPPYARIAPSYLFGHNLFQSSSFTVNGKELCSVTNNLAQVAAFQHRLTKSYAGARTYENLMNFASPWLAERLRATRGLTTNDVLSFTEGDMEVTNMIGEAPYPSAGTTVTKAGNNFTFAIGGVNLSTLLLPGDRVFVTTIEGNNWEIEVESVNAAGSIVVAKPNILAGDAGANAVNRMTRIRKVPFRNHSSIVLMYQPPLPIFSLEHALPGGCLNELIMTPFTDTVLQKRAVEGVDELYNGSKVTIEENSLFVYNFQSAPMASTSFYLDFTNFECRSQAHTNGTTQGNLSFDVPPSTWVLGVAFQATNLESSYVNSPTLFKCERLVDAVGGGTRAPELSCTYLQVQYAGQSTPQFDPTISYANRSNDIAPSSPHGDDGYNQRWIENQVICQGFRNPGESFSEWKQAGPLFLQQYIKVAGDQSTRAVINYRLLYGSNAVNVLCFAVYRSAAKIDLDADGKWQSTDVTMQ